MSGESNLLTVAKPELLDQGSDRMFRSLLYDFFAFGSSLEAARAKFADHVGLSPTQYLILIAISQASERELVGVEYVARRLHLSGAFVTIEVNKLVTAGLVEKRAHPSDGRRVQLEVTPTGKNRLARLARFQRPVNDALFDALSAEEFRLLCGMLRRLADGGASAVQLASHIQARLGLEEEVSEPTPRQQVKGRSSARQRAR